MKEHEFTVKLLLDETKRLVGKSGTQDVNALFPADGPFDPLASVETGAGESGGTADVGAVSEDVEGGGDDDIDDGGDGEALLA